MILHPLIQTGFIGINFAMAAWEAHLIKQNRPIKHGWWIVVYYLAVAAVIIPVGYWWGVLTLTLVRAVSFDPMLNIERGDNIDYQSKTSTSIVDRIERFIFRGNFWLEKGVYAVLLVAGNILIKL